ncbi:tetratricopeptide repeat protein [Granulicella pectinivorans]|uniref:tetratricopeptide repeat protein n=1 Tax=Granulicella pectinivorans TaxID=474950 RepID=UPI001FE939B1|nr:tetratricopeptide repeat protein [Granulicella pectinivorans]
MRGEACSSAPQVQTSKEDNNPVDQQTKAALKQDNFIEVTGTSIHWANENRRSVITTSVILLVVVLIAVGSVTIYNRRSEAAATDFGAAMQAYQTPLAAPGQQVPPGTKTYSSVNERAKAANELFNQVADKYSMTPSGKLAHYFSGLTYMEEGQNQSAEDALKSVANGWNKDLGGLAKLSLAQLYHQTGRDQLAVDTYNDLVAKPTSTVPSGIAQLQLAELYQAENKPAEARKIYAQLSDKDAKGAAGAIAKQKLNPNAAPQMQQ